MLNKKFVVAITGGGSIGVGNYLASGGKSEFFLEGIIPYSQKSLELFIGGKPDKYCSLDTAFSMALASYYRARLLAGCSKGICGVGVTCMLKKEGQREDRRNVAYIVVHNSDEGYMIELELNKNRTRKQQEEVVGTILDSVLITGLLSKYINYEDCTVIQNRFIDFSNVQDVYNKSKNYIILNNNTGRNIVFKNAVIYSGSFNPFTEAHKDIVKYIRDNRRVQFLYLEISINNFDKPDVTPFSLNKRLKSIPTDLVDGIIVSRSGKFREKHVNYGGKQNYVVGYDTLTRISLSDINFLGNTGTNFLAFPRIQNGILLNKPYNSKYITYIENGFSPKDISSSEIRRINSYE